MKKRHLIQFKLLKVFSKIFKFAISAISAICILVSIRLRLVQLALIRTRLALYATGATVPLCTVVLLDIIFIIKIGAQSIVRLT